MKNTEKLVEETNYKITRKAIKILLFTAAPLVVLSFLRIIEEGWLPVMALHGLILLGLSVCYFGRENIKISYQSYCIILTFVAIGSGAMIHNNGIIYASPFYILSLFFTSLIFSMRVTIMGAFILFMVQIGFIIFTEGQFSIHIILILISYLSLGLVIIFVNTYFKKVLVEAIAKQYESTQQVKLAMESKRKFLAIISHELRTPVNSIIMAAELLKKGKLDEKNTRYTNIVLSSSEMLTSILNDLLDLIKNENGKLKIDYYKTDIINIATKLSKIFELKASMKNLKVNLHIDDNFPNQMLSDPTRIRQVILNLMSNAVKFTNEGSISLFLNVTEICGEMANIEIKVQDTGIGIKEESLKLLFQDFQQLDSSITRKYGGTGLGLAITHSLTELMGGKIEVQSEYGKGTTFTVKLSLKILNETVSDTNIEKLPEMKLIDESKLKVLIVDDNVINAKLLMLNLKESNFEIVDVATSGVEALEKSRKNPYDLIFMDVQMPVMGGIEVAKKIRAGEVGQINQSTRIVALTGNSSEKDVTNCLNAGMNDFLIKPVGIYELVGFIKKLP